MPNTESVFIGTDAHLHRQLATTLSPHGVYLGRRDPDSLQVGERIGPMSIAYVEFHPGWLPRVRRAITLKCGFVLPFCVVTPHPTVAAAVESLRSGALDFLTSPIDPRRLLTNQVSGRQLAERAWILAREWEAAAERIASITPREMDVLELVVAGRMNKQIASALHISEKTVEAHRHRIMKRLQVQSTVEIVRFACRFMLDEDGQFSRQIVSRAPFGYRGDHWSLP
ncbi:MAG: hypothetical protein KatS3mg111_3433 [Pirellulaceae bacterium]|nr:MAG: hypothetical protein KatS3mg111_3433 [Pirellulaceae bacterium]